MRTRVVLPEALVKEIDTLVGKGKMRRFIEEALRVKLRSGELVFYIGRGRRSAIGRGAPRVVQQPGRGLLGEERPAAS